VPDLTFLATEHLDRMTDEGLIAGAPDLVIEISSPSTRHRDRVTKLHAYREAGVPWYWIVDPDDLIIEEYRLTPEGYLVAQSVATGDDFEPGLFPGLTISLAELLGVSLPSEANETGE
jgi:Uma2 family endonuclease